jgi:hypothetical protein
VTRNTRRMIERLDPFSLPQEGLRPLALTGGAAKPEGRGEAEGGPRAPPTPRQRKKAPRRK